MVQGSRLAGFAIQAFGCERGWMAIRRSCCGATGLLLAQRGQTGSSPVAPQQGNRSQNRLRSVRSRAAQNIDLAWFKVRDLLVSQFRPLVANWAAWRFGVPVAEQQGYFWPEGAKHEVVLLLRNRETDRRIG